MTIKENLGNRFRQKAGIGAIGGSVLFVLILTVALGAICRADEELAKLHEACRCSDFAALPQEGADLRTLSPGVAGKAALHWAVEGLPARSAERLRIVQALLDRGADVNQRSGDGRTPFQHACREGWDRPLLDLLLTRGTAIDALEGKTSASRPNAGTALHRAAERRDVELITYLLEKRADPRCLTPRAQETPLHRVFARAVSLESEKARARSLACVRLLVDAGCPPDATDSRGRTALHQAAIASHFEAIKELLSRGTSIDARNSEGWSAMHCAVMNRANFDRRVIKCLHSRAAGLLDATDKLGNTPCIGQSPSGTTKRCKHSCCLERMPICAIRPAGAPLI